MTTLGIIAILAMWWCLVALASVYLEHREEKRQASMSRHPIRRNNG